jgi:long-chain acyl-CoA synthetase
LGIIDDDGFLRITGRVNDTIVLSSGRKIQPEMIETQLANEPLIAQVMVLGYGRKFPTALVVPQPNELKKLIKHERVWVWSKRRAVSHPRILKVFRERIARLLAENQSHEQIERICLVTRGWTVESGELTDNLKLRRQRITQNFANEIERLYAD